MAHFILSSFPELGLGLVCQIRTFVGAVFSMRCNSAKCNIYVSHLCYDVSVCLSVR